MRLLKLIGSSYAEKSAEPHLTTMNKLDIEIARFMQTSELSFHFAAENNSFAFAYRYFKENARAQLSPRAYGRLCQDLKLQNIQGFTRSYKAARQVIDSAIKMRYLVTTLSDEERVSSMLGKFEKHRISVKRDLEPPRGTNTLLKEFRMGVIFVPNSTPSDISELTIHYSLPAPAFLHLVRDTAAAWGYAGDYPIFCRNKLATVTLKLTDDDNEQMEMIKLGESKARETHPQLAKK